MEEYKAIMKLIDNKLAEQEGVIEYYRGKQKEWEEESMNLANKILQLEGERCNLESQYEALVEETKRMDVVISDLKQANEYMKKQLNDF
jgi:chromosome segregation ATPase